jgi:tetratricopeptide (TPR) repeat protein
VEERGDRSLQHSETGFLINQKMKRSTKSHQQLRSTLVRLGVISWIVFCSTTLSALAQSVSTSERELPAPRPGLVTVHFPDLTPLEPEVREQLSSFESSLAKVARNSSTTDVALAEAYGTMGQIYQAYNLIAPARESYLNANTLAAQEFRWVYLLAKLDQLEERFDDALRRLEVAGRIRPEYAAVLENAGQIKLQQNHLPEAEKIFKAALEIEPESSAALYGLGQIALSRRDFTGAVKYFEDALLRSPEASRIHYSLAMAYRGLGETEKAKQHLSQQGTIGVRASDPLLDNLQNLIKGERIYLLRGRLALEAKSYTEAAVEFRKAIAANPKSLVAQLNLGAALTQLGDLSGAGSQYETALKLDPKNPIAHFNLSVLLANENKHQAAIDHLQTVLSEDPRDLRARFFLASELLKSGELAKALDEFSQVAAADPDNEEALLEKVKLLSRSRQYKLALDELERSNARYPQKGQTAALLAYLLAGSPQLELRNGTKALQLAQSVYAATGSFEHGVLIAMAQGELGRCKEATDWLRKLSTKAEQENKTEILAKLKQELQLYENKQTCRPGSAK